ncbi:MAG: glutamine--fructose-6-phosphate transaminase (isomerizing) [Polyangiaceae bacterium]|jgi:glucosamine--fructose-6-phosphate aminotransferase (isomerizing)|nr:glutamine--fructose-6-phosphate transaminase (isomerizing) [Polyangiaceae bacterium]
MCGIVGYIGPQVATPLLLDGLKKLEYRGYDSAGLAVHDGQQVQLLRAVGKLANLGELEKKTPLSGRLGIGHTRWATHGRPSETNAHPHVVAGVAVVHNGIIENHLALRQALEKEGVRFSSDTDTEIVSHLVSRAKKRGLSLLDAVRDALAQVRGSYAIAVVADDTPDRFVVAKSGSPLVLGLGQGETLCGSDIPALLAHTRRMIFLEDGDLAELTADGVRIENEGAPVQRAVRHIDWSPVMAERGGYKHFMLKEIHEQPRVIEDTLRGRIDLAAGDVVPDEIGISPEVARSLGRVYLVACGTSAHAALAGRYWIEQLARVPAVVELASEVRYREPVFFPNDLVIAVSQSGETIDTMAAVKAAREQGARVLAVANVLDSAIPRASDGALYTHAGPEIGVASTKCFTAQLAALLLVAVYLGRRRGTLDEGRGRELLQALVEAPQHMRRILGQAPYIRSVAKQVYLTKDMLFLGRGLGFPIALEGALKLKEISYIHAEGYAAGEMKHGPIALIDANMPVAVVCPRDTHYEKTLSNVQEVRAREGQVFAIATEGDEQVADLAQYLFLLPDVRAEILPLLTVLPLQLLAYYAADLKGTDVDQPRNLAKTVTVE